ncbi:MAG: hypothetical protein ACYTE3_03305 [Planctomycetota bacterium]
MAQLVLARRNPGDDGWMNILVVVVMAVIWIVGSVVKAMKAKSGEEQQPGRASSRKPPAHGRAGQRQIPGRPQRPAGPTQSTQAPKKRTTLADLRAAARKFAADAERAFQPQTTKPKPTPPAPPSKPAIQPELAPIIEQVTPEFKGLPDNRPAAAQTPPARQLSDLLSDYTDTDKLRKAILHYEILGPPLSMRD